MDWTHFKNTQGEISACIALLMAGGKGEDKDDMAETEAEEFKEAGMGGLEEAREKDRRAWRGGLDALCAKRREELE